MPAFWVLLSSGHVSEATPATGTLEGMVRLGGAVRPGPTMIANTTDPGVCGERQSLEDLLVSEADGGLANVIVSIIDAPAGAPEAGPGSVGSGTLVLDNVDCRFDPHASVLTVGDSIAARNGDDVLHTVHYYGALERNLSLPRRSVTRRTVVDRAGMIAVRCDVHGWMQAYIRVDPHRHHAVSDRDGRFRIARIPPGEYTVELWHERLGTRTRTVRIEADATTVLEVEYPLEPDP